MPSRIDEFWASDKDGELRYCGKHERYYKSDFGCQLCEIEHLEISLINNEKVVLIECPVCHKKSLNFFELLDHYECMNNSCKRAFSKQQIAQLLQSAEESLPTLQAVPSENIPSGTVSDSLFLKCPECSELTLVWDIPKRVYKCTNRDCLCAFPQKLLMSIYREQLLPQSTDTPELGSKGVDPVSVTKQKLAKCPICWKMALLFDATKKEYECLNCRRKYSPSEYEELRHRLEDEPSGKAWFGNEYYDPKKKKWRKP